MGFGLYLLAPIAAVALFCLGVFFWTALSHFKFVLFHRRESGGPPPMGRGEWVRFYLHTLQGAFLLLWWSIRGIGLAGYRSPRVPETGRPVLCVHGIFMNSTCMWGIRRALADAGRGTRAISLGVPLPTPLAYAGPLTRVMEQMASDFPESGYDVVAHSLGGVMLREVLRRRPELAARLKRVVTLGSPHHGTAFARWMRFGPLYRMLNRHSTYLAKLPTFAQLAPDVSATTVATTHDLVVYPTSMAHLEGARQITLDRISHLGLMVQPEVMGVIVEALSESHGPHEPTDVIGARSEVRAAG